MNKKNFLLLILLASLLSCVESPLELKKKANSLDSSLSDYYGTNKSLVYLDNPIILSQNRNRSSGSFKELNLEPRFITSNPILSEKCFFTENISPFVTQTQGTFFDCLSVKKDSNPGTTFLTSTSESWNYPVDSDEFIEVNTFYHMKKLSQEFLKTLSFAQKHILFGGGLPLIPATPANMKDTMTFWLTRNGLTQTLTAYSKCYMEDMNAYFDPASAELCFGWNEEYQRKYKFSMAQDPSVIYHEMGHALIKVMLNERNVKATFPLTSKLYEANLGSLFYDEAGAINEGISDYFSYYMNGRDSIGEWAMGRFFDAARPLRESSSLHKVSVAETFDKRLSYPDFLQYDPNETSKNYEDVHYAGQTVSHYLVALTEELKNTCSFPAQQSYSRVSTRHEASTNIVMTLLNETLAEIGDLFSTRNGSLSPLFMTNLNEENAYLWTQVVNPPNMKRFFQIFAKNIKLHMPSFCPSFNDDKSEILLDSYGLLLFKNYEDQKYGMGGASSQVDELNRRKSVLISKDFIELPTDRSIAYVFDSRQAIESIISQLTFEGENVQITDGLAGVNYNNNNIQISPGEVVGVSLNLVNNSNSTMAGVQILANDFDHMELKDSTKTYVNNIANANAGLPIASFSPCKINDFPKTNEGGVSCGSTTADNKGIYGTPPRYAIDSPQPVCFVQKLENNQVTWVSQDELRKTIGLSDHECLNKPSMSGNKFNPNECLMRFLPGANQAILGKIDPGKTWGETLQGNSPEAPVFNQSTLLLMEVNKWVPPGTTFNCRLRVRFSNCQDCYMKNATQEYSENEYASHEPFKVINFNFMVNQ